MEKITYRTNSSLKNRSFQHSILEVEEVSPNAFKGTITVDNQMGKRSYNICGRNATEIDGKALKAIMEKYPVVRKIKTKKSASKTLSKIVIDYAIEHDADSLVEDKYIKKLDPDSVEEYLEFARYKGEAEIIKKFVVFFNKEYKKKELDLTI